MCAVVYDCVLPDDSLHKENRSNPSFTVYDKEGILEKIFKTAVSPFGISLTPSLLILYHNVACLKFGGDLAVNAYALISSTVGSYRVLLIGVAEGIQPLASYAYGAHDFHAIRKIRNKAVITAMGVSFFLFIFTIATARFYPAIYGYEGEAAEFGYHAVMVTAAQLILQDLSV